MATELRRLSHVSVEGLFGLFNHEIPLKVDDHITLVHGPNGYGKTVMLRMLEGLLGSHFAVFYDIPFRRFQISFTDGSSVGVVQDQDRQLPGMPRIHKVQLRVEWDDAFRGRSNRETPKRPSTSDLRTGVSMIEEEVPELVRIGVRAWKRTTTGEVLTLDDVLDRYPHLAGDEAAVVSEDLQNLLASVQVLFIDTDRLSTFASMPGVRSPMRTPTVTAVAKDIDRHIQETLAASAGNSASLDRSFPKRLIDGLRDNPPDTSDILSQMALAEIKRQRLEDLGLFDKETTRIDEMSLDELAEISHAAIHVMNLYVTDVLQKLAFFDDLTGRISTLTQIINEQFSFKDVSVSKDHGFLISCAIASEALDAKNLSSGEQHQLVMWYRLLFETQPGTLVLIDEPEISLHVGWQVRFLRYLLEVVALSGCDVLITTHSPQIINDRWDLTVELTAS